MSHENFLPCERCKGKPCICGEYGFELGYLFSTVGRFLHGDMTGEDLASAYRDIAAHVPGQHCGGCKFCPRVRAARAERRPS